MQCTGNGLARESPLIGGSFRFLRRALFPSDPLEPRLPDEQFRDQFAELQKCGLAASIICLEEPGVTKRRAYQIPTGATVVYRGWMLSPSEYEQLVAHIRSYGATPFISRETYLASHYLPNWCPLIREYTAETMVFPADCDLVEQLKGLGWGKFFIKDFVKSLKTSVGSVISKPEDAALVLSEMQKYRGTIEGGICVRRFEEYVPDSERRYFVIDGEAFANSGPVPELVTECARRVSSPFFSVDIAMRSDGVLRVVEIGDGQVSDLVGWDVHRFAELWQEYAGA